MNPSIQRRLSLWLSIVILVAGVVAGVLSYFLAYRDATTSQDSQLAQVASALSRGSYKDAAPNNAVVEGDSVDEFIVVPVGVPPSPGTSPPELELPLESRDGLQTVVQRGKEWRVKVTRDSNGERFGVVQSMEARDEDARDGARLTLIPIALLIPLLLVSVHVALKTLFSPLAQLSRQVDQVTGSSLTTITDEHVPRELVPFVDAVNRLLRRLGQTLAQQARFIADAAHEMRSPVAALMVQAENVRHCELSREADQRLSLLRNGLSRMAALQDQLLSLARAQAQSPTSPQAIDLDVVVRHAVEDLLPLALSKGIDVGCSRLEGVRVLGELRHAMSLVRNALDNAIRYTPPGGSVDIALYCDGRIARFVVEDSGPGMNEADMLNVFEPFVRVLGTQESGSGLGLAIVRAAAEAMNGTVELSARPNRLSGLRFTYRQAAVSETPPRRNGPPGDPDGRQP